MRLNSGYRREIVRAAIAGAFDKEAKKLIAREHRLAQRCYDALIPAKLRRAMLEFPKGWFREREDHYFNIAGASIKLKSEHPLAQPYKLEGEYNGRIGVIAAGPLADDVMALVADKETTAARRTEAENTLSSLVNQHSTTEGLIEAWPEGCAFVKDLERKVPVANLPAVRIEELNAMLGLKQAA
jgi:hypothetical protein